MDLSRDEEGATQDRSNAPITTTNDPEQVRCRWNSVAAEAVEKANPNPITALLTKCQILIR